VFKLLNDWQSNRLSNTIGLLFDAQDSIFEIRQCVPATQSVLAREGQKLRQSFGAAGMWVSA